MSQRAILMVSCALLVSACATQGLERADRSTLNPPVIGGPDVLRNRAMPPASPSDVRLPTASSEGSSGELTAIRSNGLREAAQSYGSQMGYARRAWEILGRLENRSSDLSTVFDFNRVVSVAPVGAGVVIPPVVSRSMNAFLTDAQGREASVADEYLTIVRPGRLAPVVPTWRDYLVFGAAEPDTPPNALLPDGRLEQDRFREWFNEGWSEGVQLADSEFQSRVDRLNRDFTGMLQYRRLVSQGMMDRMVLADADFGVTIDGAEMRIGSRAVRIVSDAQFQGNPQRWSLRSVSEKDALIVESGDLPGLSARLF